MTEKIKWIVICALLCVAFWQYLAIQTYRYHLMDFQRANCIWKYTEQNIREVKKHCGDLWIIVYAIGYKERGLGSHTYGIKKIDLWIQLSYPPELWQLIQCRELVKERFRGPPSLEAFRDFGKMYCPHCPRWGDDCWLIYKKKLREVNS